MKEGNCKRYPRKWIGNWWLGYTKVLRIDLFASDALVVLKLISWVSTIEPPNYSLHGDVVLLVTVEGESRILIKALMSELSI